MAAYIGEIVIDGYRLFTERDLEIAMIFATPADEVAEADS